MRDQFLKELKTLSPEEKLTVTEILWDSLKEEDMPISESQLNIIREREEEYKADWNNLYMWDQ
jgi:putative addiction module component (TIGR02574 family)